MASGWITPAANPCKTRPTTIRSRFGLTPASTEPAVKMQRTTMNVRRGPKASTNHAFRSWLATMVAINAVAKSCASSWPTPNAPITSGTATFTMVALNTMMKEASIAPVVTNSR